MAELITQEPETASQDLILCRRFVASVIRELTPKSFSINQKAP
jgi:hypothetical protein